MCQGKFRFWKRWPTITPILSPFATLLRAGFLSRGLHSLVRFKPSAPGQHLMPWIAGLQRRGCTQLLSNWFSVESDSVVFTPAHREILHRRVGLRKDSLSNLAICLTVRLIAPEDPNETALWPGSGRPSGVCLGIGDCFSLSMSHVTQGYID